MVTVERVDPTSRLQVRRFIDFPHSLYAGTPQWVPPINRDVVQTMDRRRHPFYEKSDADFFVALRNGRTVGRIAALENRPFNEFHGMRQADFYFFDCENDPEVSAALLGRVTEWARERGLDRIAGPKGFSALDGYGVLVEGFEHRQLMMMMNYNHAYYPALLEAAGFVKEVDFISCYLNRLEYRLPERIRAIARRMQTRSGLRVMRFGSKRELLRWAGKIGEAYNKAFVRNWEYYPLTARQVEFVVKNIMLVADHRLIKIIAHGDEIVGFLLGFPDVSAALQRIRGRLRPLGIARLLLEMRRTDWLALNGAGILPEYQGIGGNALLYTEIEKTVNETRFVHVDLTQVAETAVQMQRDLVALGARPYKRHRVFVRKDI